MQALHQKYGDKGLVIMCFPCTQFGQERGTDDQISAKAERLGVSFPIFQTVKVNGRNTDPFWRYLKQEAPGVGGTTAVKWNFTKFVVDRRGVAVHRAAPSTKVSKLESIILPLLQEEVR
mmetsp:Transcript_121385/g.278160  ORF Transcript_121385/g.278160 Transcript_121385/m.278160 type:complete len:119 (-) Transcript_121385:149-505(-)